MKFQPSTACCGLGLYWDPLYFIGGSIKVRFASVRRCPKCKKMVGDPKMDYPNGNDALTAVQKMWNGTSFSMAMDVQAKRPGAPLDFEKGGAGILIPLGYQGDLKEQAELPDDSEEVPF